MAEAQGEARLIDGKAHALGLRHRVAKGVAELVAAGRKKPGLATVLVGDDARQDDRRQRRAGGARKHRRRLDAGAWLRPRERQG